MTFFGSFLGDFEFYPQFVYISVRKHFFARFDINMEHELKNHNVLTWNSKSFFCRLCYSLGEYIYIYILLSTTHPCVYNSYATVHLVMPTWHSGSTGLEPGVIDQEPSWSDNRSEPNRQKARTATAETTDCRESFHGSGAVILEASR